METEKLRKYKLICLCTIIGSAMQVIISCTPKITTSDTKQVILTEKENLDFFYAYTEAHKQKIMGQIDKATSLFRECLKINPESSGAHFELSNIFYYTGRTDEALYHGREALKKDPENVWFLLHLANIYHQKNYKDSAIFLYRKIVKLEPERLDYKYNLATLLNAEGNHKEAIRLFDEIEESYGVSESVCMAREQIYYHSGKIDLAVRELMKLISFFPDEIRYHGILAELYSETGQDAKAEEVYERIFVKDPKNGMAQLSVSEFYRKRKEYEKVFDMLQKAYTNPGLDIESKVESCLSLITSEEEMNRYRDEIEELVMILYRNYGDQVRIKTLAADFYLRTEQLNDAANLMKEILLVEKENFLVWQQLIFILDEQSDYQEMERYAAEAMKYFADNPDLPFYRAIALNEMGKNKEARDVLKNILGSKNIEKDITLQVLILLGEVAHDMSFHEESDSCFEKALEIDPENILVLNNYAYYLSLRGKDLEKAERYSRKCIQREPDSPTYLDTYAWILYKMNNIEGALKYIEIALHSGGDNDKEILDHYGDILYRNGREAEAVKAWEKAYSLDQGDMLLKRKIETGRITDNK